MLSRVADSLYWMSRYLERAEHTARVIDVQLNLMLDESAGSSRTPLVCAGGRAFWNPCTLKASPEGDVSTDAQVRGFDLISRLHPVGARECAAGARADQLRDVGAAQPPVPRSQADEHVRHLGHAARSDFLTAVIEGSHLFQGITDSTMSHGEGWQFIQLGRSLERATATAQLLDVHFQAFKDNEDQAMDSGAHLEWIGLLRTCTAFEAYCKVYTADLKPERVAEFLLLNADFPHSIRFSADQMQQSLECIHEITASKKAARVSKLAGRLRAELTFHAARRDHGQSQRILRDDPAAMRADPYGGAPGIRELSD